jgi:hypothetical protein
MPVLESSSTYRINIKHNQFQKQPKHNIEITCTTHRLAYQFLAEEVSVGVAFRQEGRVATVVDLEILLGVSRGQSPRD